MVDSRDEARWCGILSSFDGDAVSRDCLTSRGLRVSDTLVFADIVVAAANASVAVVKSFQAGLSKL